MIAAFENFFDLYVEAGSLSTSSERLAELACHPKRQIRLRVAENPNTSLDTLKVLMQDVETDVLVALAANTNMPVSFLQDLARDPDVTVRLGLAQELNCPLSVLQMLENDEHPYVSFAARRTMELICSSANLSHLDKFTRKKLKNQKAFRSARRA